MSATIPEERGETLTVRLDNTQSYERTFNMTVADILSPQYVIQYNLRKRTLREADTLPRADKASGPNLREATTSKLWTADTDRGPECFLQHIFTLNNGHFGNHTYIMQPLPHLLRVHRACSTCTIALRNLTALHEQSCRARYFWPGCIFCSIFSVLCLLK